MQGGRPAFTTRHAAAITKAVALGTAATVQRVRFGHYLVGSSDGTRIYRVTVVGSRYSCECPAGQHGQACVHSAAIWIAKFERTNKVRVIGPGTLLPNHQEVS